jgi:hypothetical protein
LNCSTLLRLGFCGGSGERVAGDARGPVAARQLLTALCLLAARCCLLALAQLVWLGSQQVWLYRLHAACFDAVQQPRQAQARDAPLGSLGQLARAGGMLSMIC